MLRKTKDAVLQAIGTYANVFRTQWITDALAHPDIVGAFRCQLIGTHGNDHWFEGRAKRNYLKDDGTPFPSNFAKISEANRAALKYAYQKAAAAKP